MAGLQIPTNTPVLVTGANGYVASWVVKELLNAGVTVHAAVRDPSNASKVGHLKALADKAPGEIKFFKADLLDEGSYAEGMEGCSVVFHTASPFTLNVKDPQTELVDPALKGTRNVLESASKTPSVKRVVVTSSCAAIYTDAAECQKMPGGMVTEDVWNTTASLSYQPYNYSKTLAEKAAWELAESQSQWDLVTVNPSLVIGPALSEQCHSESLNILRQLGDGTMKDGAPYIGVGVVDVRDVAKAHIAAAFTPSAKGRYIVSGHNSSFIDLAKELQEKYGKEYPIPKSAPPKFLVWLIAPWVGLERRYVWNNINYEWKGDNSKGKRELGLTYRPLKQSMEDMFEYMLDAGYIKRKA